MLAVKNNLLRSLCDLLVMTAIFYRYAIKVVLCEVIAYLTIYSIPYAYVYVNRFIHFIEQFTNKTITPPYLR